MKLIEMNWPDVRQVSGHAVALLPIAAIEQHGPHLAVSTDTALITHVAEGAEAALPDDVVLCPTLPFGSSHHHLGFGATLSISHETYIRVLVDLVESLLAGGFRRIVVLNGHGGNITPGKQAMVMLSNRHDDKIQPNIAFATYWELGGPAFKGQPPLETPALSHACEYETSMMLHLYPERVRMERAVRSTRPERNGYIGWEDDEVYRGVTMSKRTHFVSNTGASGCPQLANAAKGEHLLAQAIAATAKFLGEFKTWPFMEDRRETEPNA